MPHPFQQTETLSHDAKSSGRARDDAGLVEKQRMKGLKDSFETKDLSIPFDPLAETMVDQKKDEAPEDVTPTDPCESFGNPLTDSAKESADDCPRTLAEIRALRASVKEGKPKDQGTSKRNPFRKKLPSADPFRNGIPFRSRKKLILPPESYAEESVFYVYPKIVDRSAKAGDVLSLIAREGACVHVDGRYRGRIILRAEDEITTLAGQLVEAFGALILEAFRSRSRHRRTCTEAKAIVVAGDPRGLIRCSRCGDPLRRRQTKQTKSD